MKRSFKVATAFTGAVACAGALAPVADAATATLTPAAATKAQNCADNSGPQPHLYYSKNAHHSLAACIKGGPGYVSFIGGKKFAGICGGAWSGSFYYAVPGTSISGRSYFSPGYFPVRWHQTDEIYKIVLAHSHYVQGVTSCPNHG